MPKRVLLFAAAALLTLGIGITTTDHAAAVPDPLTCEGYAEKRVFVESQGWWIPTNEGVGEHIHVATCFPHAETVKGTVDFDVRVMLHDSKAKAYLLRIAVGSTVLVQKSISMACDTDCTQWHKLSLDTTKWAYDGRQELRFTVKAKEADGKIHYQSTGWQAYFANGKPVQHYRSSDLVIARGWYTGYDYTNAQLDSALPAAPVSGTWSPRVKFTPKTTAGATYMATIDPSFHVGNAGTVVLSGAGSGSKTLSIDTTKLTNGRHNLVLLAHDKRTGGTNSGVQVLPFTVQN